MLTSEIFGYKEQPDFQVGGEGKKRCWTSQVPSAKNLQMHFDWVEVTICSDCVCIAKSVSRATLFFDHHREIGSNQSNWYETDLVDCIDQHRSTCIDEHLFCLPRFAHVGRP